MATQWIWVDTAVALAAHREQLAEHGGSDGIRDRHVLENAMARPKNLAAYEEPDAPALAASYAFGIASNHPFVDGSKRTAAVLSETFLLLNGYEFVVGDPELAVVFLALAAGEMDEQALAAWFREHVIPKRI